MQMISFIFLIFMIAVLTALYLEERFCGSNKIRIEKITLLAASYLFMGYANVGFAVILAIKSAITWYCAKKQTRIKCGIVIMILLLGVFKYINFFFTSFASLLGAENNILLKIILPLGISFYTFSAISYLVDVKRGKEEACGFADVALYLSFFPKLTSGPIQRSQDFFEQINRPRNINFENVSTGLQIFAFGVFKKLVLADNLSVFVNQVYETPLAFSSATVFLAVVSYSLQIYFDFSGYSDMAIGVARMMDIRLPDNFNLPYLSHNVTEFWKRWHITLSSWLQEYLYFPLGGNRKGKARTYLNLILTMVIGGIWHGANWTYIMWGLTHGIGLAIHKIWVKVTGSNKKRHSVFANILSVAATFSFVSFCWIFFRAESLQDAFVIIKQLFGFHSGISHPFVWTFAAIAVITASSVLAAVKSDKNKLAKMNQSYVQGYYPVVNMKSFWGLVGFFVFAGLILTFAYTGGSPFIYGAY